MTTVEQLTEGERLATEWLSEPGHRTVEAISTELDRLCDSHRSLAATEWATNTAAGRDYRATLGSALTRLRAEQERERLHARRQREEERRKAEAEREWSMTVSQRLDRIESVLRHLGHLRDA